MSKIAFLGYCSNSFSKKNNVSFLYENGANKMLVDCGSTVLLDIHSLVSSLLEINFCFISHSHFDHFLGLPYFLIGRNLDAIAKMKENPDFVVPDLNIIIEKKLQLLLIELLHKCHPDIKKLNYNINFIDLDDSRLVDTGDFKIQTKKMNHTVDTYGFYIIENGEKTLSYSSDTLYDEDIIDFFKESKYLILEGMVPNSESKFSKMAKHATFDNALEVINKTKAKFSFVVHLQPRYLGSVNQIEYYLNNNSDCKIGFPKVGEWYVLHI